MPDDSELRPFLLPRGVTSRLLLPPLPPCSREEGRALGCGFGRAPAVRQGALLSASEIEGAHESPDPAEAEIRGGISMASGNWFGGGGGSVAGGFEEEVDEDDIFAVIGAASGGMTTASDSLLIISVVPLLVS